MLCGGAAEAVSLSLLFPFLTVMANPEKIIAAQTTQKILNFFNLHLLGNSNILANIKINQSAIQIYLACLFSLVAIFTGAVRVLLTWGSFRLAGLISTDLSSKAYLGFLHQPLLAQTSKNSSKLLSALTSKMTFLTLSIHLISQVLTKSTILRKLFTIKKQVVSKLFYW